MSIEETVNRTGPKTILIQHSGHIPITELNPTFEEQENLFNYLNFPSRDGLSKSAIATNAVVHSSGKLLYNSILMASVLEIQTFHTSLTLIVSFYCLTWHISTLHSGILNDWWNLENWPFHKGRIRDRCETLQLDNTPALKRFFSQRSAGERTEPSDGPRLSAEARG